MHQHGAIAIHRNHATRWMRERDPAATRLQWPNDPCM